MLRLQSKFPFAPLETQMPTMKVPALTSFASLGISGELMKALETMSIQKPTTIQKLVVPRIIQGTSVLCAAETGSGKTLSYLLPIVHMLKKQEEEASLATSPTDESKKWIRMRRRPRAVILLPSRELVDQILSVAKVLSYHAKYRAISLTTTNLARDLSEPVDLVISTPHRLLSLIQEGK